LTAGEELLQRAMNTTARRIDAIDFSKGILVLAMVVYHSMNYAGYESLPRDYMGSCRHHSSCSWDSC